MVDLAPTQELRQLVAEVVAVVVEQIVAAILEPAVWVGLQLVQVLAEDAWVELGLAQVHDAHRSAKPGLPRRGAHGYLLLVVEVLVVEHHYRGVVDGVDFLAYKGLGHGSSQPVRQVVDVQLHLAHGIKVDQVWAECATFVCLSGGKFLHSKHAPQGRRKAGEKWVQKVRNGFFPQPKRRKCK